MSIKKRAAALICSCMMAASLASCADTSYICKADDVSVNAGVYIYYVISQISNQEYTYYYKNGAMSDDIINEAYGDGTMTVGDYAQSAAYESCQTIAAIQMKFNELGLELSSDDKAAISDAVEEGWNEEYYESIGVGKSSLEQMQTSSVMLDKIFSAYYDKGGIKEVSDSDMKKHVEDNYVRFKLISIAKSKQDEGKEAKKKAEELLAMTKEEDFKDFDDVIEKYEKELKEDKKDDSSSDSDDEEHDHISMVNKNSSSYSSNKVIKHINSDMKNDEIDICDDDYYWYVIQKLDVKDYGDYIKDNRTALLDEMKGEEFDKAIDSWVEEYQIERNEDSYSRYTAKSVYKKYEKYLETKK